MIYEFAVDPEAVNNWKDFRYVIEKFGVSNGRLISRFPKNWKRMVYEACEKCNPIERKKIEEKLIKIDVLFLRNSRDYIPEYNWIGNAVKDHAKKPFKLIITNETNNEIREIVSVTDLTDDNIFFNVKREVIVKRKSSELTKYLNPLISLATEVFFVDPHFAPEASRYRKTFEAYLQCINLSKITLVEFHLKEKSRFEFFENECMKLSRIIPQGLKVKFVRWKKMPLRDGLHPRYIFTNIGGIRIEKGLDEGDGDENTDMSLLDNSLFEIRLAEYKIKPSPFEFVDEKIVLGTKNLDISL